MAYEDLKQKHNALQGYSLQYDSDHMHKKYNLTA